MGSQRRFNQQEAQRAAGVVALLVLACGGSTATRLRPRLPGQLARRPWGRRQRLALQPRVRPMPAGPSRGPGWWTTGGEANGFNKIIRGLQRRQPDACAPTTRPSPAAPARSRQACIKAAVLAGLPPDTFQVHMGHELLDTYVNIPGGSVMAPLGTDIIDPAQFPPGVVNIISGADGSIYSVPLNIHRANELWYNKAIFTANNLQAPTTWPEFETDATALKAAGVTPLALGDSGIWAIGMVFETILIGRSAQTPSMASGPIRTSWSDPKVTDALNEYQEGPRSGQRLGQHGPQLAELGPGSGQAHRRFSRHDDHGRLGKRRLPPRTSPATVGRPPRATTRSTRLCPTRSRPVKAPHPDGAKLFLAYLANAQTQAIFNPYKGSIPANVTSGDPPAGGLQYNDYQKSAQAGLEDQHDRALDGARRGGEPRSSVGQAPSTTS